MKLSEQVLVAEADAYVGLAIRIIPSDRDHGLLALDRARVLLRLVRLAMLVMATLLGAMAGAAEYTPALRTPDLTCRVRDQKGQLVRSISRRQTFLRMIGALDPRHPQNVPPGYVVNHIVPLACGGCDVPSNMELMTVAAWKGRTGAERGDCGRHQGGSWGKP